MNKCKWFGHKWDEWTSVPYLGVGLNSSLREHCRSCMRCHTKDTKYIY